MKGVVSKRGVVYAECLECRKMISGMDSTSAAANLVTHTLMAHKSWLEFDVARAQVAQQNDLSGVPVPTGVPPGMKGRPYQPVEELATAGGNDG